MRKIIVMTLMFMLAICFAATSAMAMSYATEVTRILRGDTSIGNYTGFYGGDFYGAWPVALTEDQAKNAVLGAPDNKFLSLPGKNNSTGGTFPYAYVEVAFDGFFNADSDLFITEIGASLESAQLWIWTANGGNIQPVISRNGSDTIVVDLKPYEAFMLGNGGAFTKVGIGGLDLLGGSLGFDLDAVGVSNLVPEPVSLLLLGLGLIGLAGVKKKFKKD